MSEHPNADLYRRGFSDFSSAEGRKHASATLSDDVVWWQIGSPEPLRGKQAVIDSMAAIHEEVEWTADIHDVLANDDHIVGLVVAKVGTGDRAFSYRTAEICHVEDGKITERWAFSDDTQRIIDFFSQFG